MCIVKDEWGKSAQNRFSGINNNNAIRIKWGEKLKLGMSHVERH